MYVFAASISTNLADHGISVVEKIVRTLAVYFALLVLLRVFGKRDLAQLNSFDLVVLLLLSNVVQNAVIGPDNTLVGGLVGAATLVIVNSVVVHVARRNDRLDRLFEGTETVLVRHGEIQWPAVRHLGLREADVRNAVRRQGASTLTEVERAALAPGGAIVVELRRDDENATRGDLHRLETKVDRMLRLLEAQQ
jgi:uncharacterized membrane protein YcaP (DUF421 family)